MSVRCSTAVLLSPVGAATWKRSSVGVRDRAMGAAQREACLSQQPQGDVVPARLVSSKSDDDVAAANVDARLTRESTPLVHVSVNEVPSKVQESNFPPSLGLALLYHPTDVIARAATRRPRGGVAEDTHVWSFTRCTPGPLEINRVSAARYAA